MSLRRPILSMTVSAAIVTIRLTRPMMTLSRAAALSPAPADRKMSGA